MRAVVFDDRRHARLGRHVADSVAGQQLASQGEHGHALDVVGTLDEDGADAVAQVLA